MIHEGARWSDVHSKWFLLPRKLSREPYDEIKDTKKCVNLMMAAPEGVADGEQVLLVSAFFSMLRAEAVGKTFIR